MATDTPGFASSMLAASGIGGMFLTQVMPFADVKALPLFVEFELTIYQNLERSEGSSVRPGDSPESNPQAGGRVFEPGCVAASRNPRSLQSHETNKSLPVVLRLSRSR
jgi:hypothetical protein